MTGSVSLPPNPDLREFTLGRRIVSHSILVTVVEKRSRR
jgi:hypothetical protein